MTDATPVRFTVQRRVRGYGRKVGVRCTKVTRSNRPNERCRLWTRVSGAFTASGKKGMNKIKFRGRIGGKKLTPGSYRLNSQTTTPPGRVNRQRFRIIA